ncbi:MAG TPA: hypothetical protein VG755_08565, partial [Nannocystaceae bacterium]|nr:hypothetical protein [Nannocystaceae bacterium]
MRKAVWMLAGGLVGASACGPVIAVEHTSDDAHAQADDDAITEVFAACLDRHGGLAPDACEARDAGA